MSAQQPLLMAVGQRAAGSKAEAFRLRLHATLHEHLTGLTGIVSRSAKCWQMALRGERPITLQDVAEVAIHPGREAKLATLALAALLVDVAMPQISGSEISEAVASFTAESADVAPLFIRCMEDGELNADEIASLRREALEAESRLLRLRAALTSLELSRTA